MDFSILYFIQSIRTDFLDNFMLVLTKIAGSYGQIWLCVAVLLLIFKKTRKAGIAVLLSYGFVYLFGQMVLKDLIARPRPCHIDETIALLIDRPSSFSCPSTHSAWAFGAATAIVCFSKKIGIPAFVVAAIIGFSRLYLFVHFPTDVLAGIALGVLCGLIGAWIVKAVAKAIEKRKGAVKA